MLHYVNKPCTCGKSSNGLHSLKYCDPQPNFQPKWYEKILGFFAAFLMGAW